MATVGAEDTCGLAAGYRRLASVLRDVVAEQSVGSVLARVSATLRELVCCEGVVIWERVGENELAVVQADGDDEKQMRSLRIRLGEGLTGRAAATGCAIVSNDAHTDRRAGLVPGTAATPEAVACLPLLARGHLLGALTLYRRGHDRGFKAEEAELVGHFADVAALALDNAQIRAELELLASTDDLTGLANRRRFRAELAREVASATRHRSPLSLLLLDLDNFKAVNDSHGHDAGDGVLRLVAKAVQTQLRAGDLAARLGGDEFAILLPHTDRRAAKALAARLEHAVGAALPPPLLATASVGVASLSGDQPEALLATADRSLYRAKRRASKPPTLRAKSTPT